MKKHRMFLTVLLLLILSIPLISWAGQDVTFTWDPYTDPVDTVDGFKLYMAPAPGVAVIQANLVATILGQAAITYKQLSIPAGQHYWVLTAFKAGGLESGPSNEVSYVVKLKPPSGLGSKVVISLGSIIVTVAAK